VPLVAIVWGSRILVSPYSRVALIVFWFLQKLLLKGVFRLHTSIKGRLRIALSGIRLLKIQVLRGVIGLVWTPCCGECQKDTSPAVDSFGVGEEKFAARPAAKRFVALSKSEML